MTNSTPTGPVVLCILDGWGHREEVANNAIALAQTPNWDRLMATRPHALIETSGLAVGLPEGQMGNSEVGHTNIGAGRVVMQELPRIDKAIKDGSFATNPVLCELIDKTKAAGGALHIMGLMSPGGVHSHQKHIVAAAKIAAAEGLDVWLHNFLDGRDTPPQSAHEFTEKLTADLMLSPNVRSGTICGRYTAMDRDKNWERTQKAYGAIADAIGQKANSAIDAIDAAYARSETDEFVAPTVVGSYPGMADGDGLLMINYRADRARQILTALLDPDFDGFGRQRVKFAATAGLVEYSSKLAKFMPCLFESADLKNSLGDWASAHGKAQFRIAETEKYAHVTFFLNGGREEPFEGETRAMIPSPKVATYDLQPEMSAHEVTNQLVEAISSGTYDLLIVNYANGDMVGHTGIIEAAILAAETIDACLHRLETAVKNADGALLVTADHGNLEQMLDPENGGPHTSHTTLPVPVVLAVGSGESLRDGSLCDIAPTILSLMKLPLPTEMTGQSLLERNPESESAREAE